MDDKKINKQLFDKISAKIAVDLENALESPKLTQVSPIDVFDTNIKSILSAFYSNKDSKAQRFASILNSIYTHTNNVFILTYRLGNDLINEDPNHAFHQSNGDAYREMLHYSLKGGYITCLREPVKTTKGVVGQAGLYELTDEDFLGPLIDMIGITNCRDNKIERIKWFDKQVKLSDNDRSPIVLDENAKKARVFAKELERMRNARNQG